MRYATLALILSLAGPAVADEADTTTLDTTFLTVETSLVTGHALTISGVSDGWTVDGDLELVVDQERKTITLRSRDTAWACGYEAPE